MDNIIHRIKKLQQERNVSIPMLASGISLTKQSLYDFMSSKTAISIKNLEKIAKFFNVSMVFFFEDIEQDPKISIVNEKAAEYTTIADQLKMKDDQIKAKDDQIKFLQHLIDKEY